MFEEQHKPIEKNPTSEIPEILNESDHHFRVDLYMPKQIKQDFDFINRDSTPTQPTKSTPKLKSYKINQISPSPIKSFLDDLKVKDMMTRFLERIPSKDLSKKEEDFELSRKSHSKMMFYDADMMEEWYQRVFDYFSGMTKLDLIENRSDGLIYINFRHFLRLSTLSNFVDTNFSQSLFMSKAGVRNSEIRFLSYPDFIEILNEISLQTHPDLTGPKRLKKLTKRIYPNLMASVHGISKIYKEHTRRYMNNNIIYPRMLQIFNGEHGYITDTTISTMQFESSKNTSPIPQDGTQIMIYPETPVRRLIYDTPSVPNKEEFDSPDIRSSSRLEEKIPSDVVLDSQSKKKKKRKSWTKACGKFCAKLLKSCAKKNPKLRRRSLFGRCGTWLDRKIKKLGKWLGFEIDDLEEIDDEEEAKVKMEAPSWPVIVEIMIKNVPEAEKIYYEKEKNKGLRLMFNLTNVLAIYGKIMDVYSYCSYAFRPEIPWFPDPNININISIYLNILNGNGVSSFRRLFWISISLITIYMILVKSAILSLKRGNLGEDGNGKPASFPRYHYFVVLGVQLIGGAFFQNITKWLLDTFVCNYNQTPWVMARDPSIECLSNDHFFYIIFGVLGLVIYYPTCTFMFPNFQFQNKMLDLKYHPSWVVILIQIKLILTCIFSFFKSSHDKDTSTNVNVQLISTFVIMIILGISEMYLRPCLVKKFNIFDVGGYFLAAFINIASFILYMTEARLAMVIVLFVGSFAIIFGTYGVYRLIYKGVLSDKKVKKVHNNDQILIFDESKRRPENKDLEEMKKELAEQEARKKEREEEMAKEIPNNVRKESPLKEDDEQDEAVFYF